MKIHKLLLYFYILAITSIQSRLRFVFELFRHGARAPYKMTGKIDSLNYTWTGNSQLTYSGMRQHFLIGNQMRQKYIIDKKLIGNSYNREEILVYSTTTNRTIMSAYSQLSGLFPPGTGKNLSQIQENIAVPPFPISDLDQVKHSLKNYSLKGGSQVFPIHLFNNKQYYFGLYDEDACKGVGNILKEKKTHPKLTQFLKKFREKYPNIIDMLPHLDFNDLEDMYDFTDTYYSGYYDQRDMSKFGNQTKLKEDVIEYLYIEMFLREFGDDNEFIAINSISQTILTIIQYFNKIVKYDQDGTEYNDIKMLLYSGHDSNIATMLITLNLGLDLKLTYSYIPFASNIFFEFTHDESKEFDNSNYHVKIIYNSDEIYFDNYENFKNKITKILIDPKKTIDFCSFEIEKKRKATHYLGFLGVLLLGILIISSITLAFSIIRKKNLEKEL